MSCVIYLANRRQTPTSAKRLSHHVGIVLPFIRKPDVGSIGSEVSGVIRNGAKRAHLIKLLTDSVRETSLPGSPEPA